MSKPVRDNEGEAYRLAQMDFARGYPYGRSTEWFRALLRSERVRFAYWCGWADQRDRWQAKGKQRFECRDDYLGVPRDDRELPRISWEEWEARAQADDERRAQETGH